MLPLREGTFDVPTWTTAKVHPDHHAQVARSLYSLPTRFIGKTVDVRADRTTVRFFLGGEMLKLHARVAPGKRSTDPNDYPVGKADYALRSVDKLKERAREHGEHVGSFAERLLGGPLPWGRMRQGYGLLRLCERYGAERVDALGDVLSGAGARGRRNDRDDEREALRGAGGRGARLGRRRRDRVTARGATHFAPQAIVGDTYAY
jgi:hypothetical protein